MVEIKIMLFKAQRKKCHICDEEYEDYDKLITYDFNMSGIWSQKTICLKCIQSGNEYSVSLEKDKVVTFIY